MRQNAFSAQPTSVKTNASSTRHGAVEVRLILQSAGNVIFERAKFNQRCQGDSKSAEQFITSLCCLAEDCAYGDLKDQMIRDRMVVEIRDWALSEKLQMDYKLTLEKAKM